MSLEKMHVQDFLLPRRVVTDLRPGNKTAVLRELSRRAAEELKVPADAISAALLKREELGSTGMGNGFAIPHAGVTGIKLPYGMLARLSEPIDFDAVDGQAVDLIFLLLLPEPSQGQQLNALASVARRLRDPIVLQALRSAKDSRLMYQKMIEPVG
jgi:PTS system nitrogen regulatory IIA component